MITPAYLTRGSARKYLSALQYTLYTHYTHYTYYTPKYPSALQIWSSSSSGKYSESWSFKGHDSEVADIAVHPTGNYLISVTADESWFFLDIARGQCLKKVSKENEDFKYTSCAFHPDGLILGTTTDKGTLKIWDIREQQNVANCDGHSGPINCLSFSENGYLVASGSDDGSAKIWDLRKLQCTKTLPSKLLYLFYSCLLFLTYPFRHFLYMNGR